MERYDLVIIGSGTGNMLMTPDIDDWKVAIVERDTFGGTCLNRGCIPSKMLVLAADRVIEAHEASRLGVDLPPASVRWGDIVERVFGRIDPIATAGEDYRVQLPNVTVVRGDAVFTGHKTLSVGDRTLTADQFVIAAGARPVVPAIPGLDEVGYHTSDTIMRVPEVPARLAVLGGGYIANEMAHVFDAMGSTVTIIQRSDALLREEDMDVSRAYTDLAAARYDLRLDTTITGCEAVAGATRLHLLEGDRAEAVDVDAVLVATGRQPNGAQLGVEATGVTLDGQGYVITDPTMATAVPGIWAVGDVTNRAQLKHTANAEGKVVSHNLVHPDDPVRVDLEPIPHAVFTSPQIAAAGFTQQALDASGTAYLSATQPYGATAYGWALEDTTGFCKVLADPDTRRLLGAHIIGPQAATLLQILVQGMHFGLTVDQMATGPLYVHPALPEVVEQALLSLDDH